MEILLNDNIPINWWESFLTINPFASPFQTNEYFKFFNSVKGFASEAVAVVDSDRIIALAVITLQKENGIKGFFTRRGIIYGGPLVDPGTPEALNFLLKGISDTLKNKTIYLETRNLNDYSSYKSIFHVNNWLYTSHLNFHLDINNENQVLSGIKYNRKREIKLSIAEGAYYEECHSLSDLNELYLILKELYVFKVKLPVPSYSFFKIFFERNLGKIFIVKHNDKIIGGCICPKLYNKALYTLYYCGLRDYHKKIFPTHLAIFAAIEYAIKNNITKLDFMGAGKPGVDYGVRKYKQEFGGKLVEHGRFIKVQNPILYYIGIFALKIYKMQYLLRTR